MIYSCREPVPNLSGFHAWQCNNNTQYCNSNDNVLSGALIALSATDRVCADAGIEFLEAIGPYFKHFFLASIPETHYTLVPICAFSVNRNPAPDLVSVVCFVKPPQTLAPGLKTGHFVAWASANNEAHDFFLNNTSSRIKLLQFLVNADWRRVKSLELNIIWQSAWFLIPVILELTTVTRITGQAVKPKSPKGVHRESDVPANIDYKLYGYVTSAIVYQNSKAEDGIKRG